MEHQTMSFMASFGYELTSHELAHQWFGDYITCKSWHDIWLNEGFATYLAGLAYEFLGNGEWWDSWKTATIQNVTSMPDGAVYCDDTTSVARIFSGRLTYKKGSMLLHMLRWELGDSLFFAGVKNYLNNPQLAYGFAESSDFINSMETTADTSLQEFFADWLYGEGYPVFVINYSQNGNDLQINLSQNSSHSSVDFFEMHIPILAVGTNSDTLLLMHHSSNNQQFNFQIDFPVQQLVLDPEQWILTKDPLINIGIEEESVLENIYIHPIPASETIFIESKKNQIESIEIFDIMGRVVLSEIYDNIKSIEINISTFQKAIYFVKVESSEKVFTQKIVVK